MLNVSPHSKFCPNWVNEKKVRFELVSLVNQKIAKAIANSFYLFILLNVFATSQFCLVGLVGQIIAVAISNYYYVFFSAIPPYKIVSKLGE